MAARAVPAHLARLPNALTILRLAAVPVFVVLLLGQDGVGSWGLAALFAAAAFTDQVDGFLARRWRVESEFGRLADPLADRLMIDAAVLVLCLIGSYPFVKDRGYEFSISQFGKAATWVLYAGVTGLIASSQTTAWPLWLFWAGLVLAIVAALVYVRKARREVLG
jgi:phosphatidylglycerophosphate synthase